MNRMEREKELAESVMSMAHGIPLESPCEVLGVELIRAMGDHHDAETKLCIMAAAYASALKMIAVQKRREWEK